MKWTIGILILAVLVLFSAMLSTIQRQHEAIDKYEELSDSLLENACITQELIQRSVCDDPIILGLQKVGQYEMCKDYLSETSAP